MSATAIVLTLVALTLVKATPLVYAALGGVISERSGVINIALEGMMTGGAFTAAVFSGMTGDPALGVLAGIGAGLLLGIVLGVAATIFKVDQIVAGTGINLVAAGGAAFALTLIYNQPGASPQVPALGRDYWILVALAFVCALLLHAVIFLTPWGLRVRACGENPRAVQDAGLNPLRLRLFAVAISGALAGLGGAFLSIGEVNLYSDGMTAGRGFIALAAVIFGRWTPFGATGAALFFGFFEALQYVVQGNLPWLPSDALAAIPYVAALVAIAGLVGKVRAPAADGVPY
jgi:ABC-type uncharacterized transport system permease subunit